MHSLLKMIDARIGQTIWVAPHCIRSITLTWLYRNGGEGQIPDSPTPFRVVFEDDGKIRAADTSLSDLVAAGVVATVESAPRCGAIVESAPRYRARASRRRLR